MIAIEDSWVGFIEAEDIDRLLKETKKSKLKHKLEIMKVLFTDMS